MTQQTCGPKRKSKVPQYIGPIIILVLAIAGAVHGCYGRNLIISLTVARLTNNTFNKDTSYENAGSHTRVAPL